jgi:hypothetical protein
VSQRSANRRDYASVAAPPEKPPRQRVDRLDGFLGGPPIPWGKVLGGWDAVLLCRGQSLWAVRVTCSQVRRWLIVRAAAERAVRDAASIRGLPLGVRNGLRALFDSIAEPRRRVSGHRRGRPADARRRLVAAGCSAILPRLLRTRRRAHTWQVALFHWFRPRPIRMGRSARWPGVHRRRTGCRLAGGTSGPVGF